MTNKVCLITGCNTGISMCHKELSPLGKTMFVYDFAIEIIPGDVGINFAACEELFRFLVQDMNIHFNAFISYISHPINSHRSFRSIAAFSSDNNPVYSGKIKIN